MKVPCILALCLLLSCGRRADNPSELKKGYVFKSGKVMYKEVNRIGGGIDSFRRTIDSFVIVDTLPGFRKYIIADSWGKMPLVVPNKNATDVVFVGGGRYAVYGVADFDGDIVVFPSYSQWIPLPNGFYGFRVFSNELAWGLLHVNGVVMTDMKYNNIFYDTTSNKIICQYGFDKEMKVDSIEPVYK